MLKSANLSRGRSYCVIFSLISFTASGEDQFGRSSSPSIQNYLSASEMESEINRIMELVGRFCEHEFNGKEDLLPHVYFSRSYMSPSACPSDDFECLDDPYTISFEYDPLVVIRSYKVMTVNLRGDNDADVDVVYDKVAHSVGRLEDRVLVKDEPAMEVVRLTLRRIKAIDWQTVGPLVNKKVTPEVDAHQQWLKEREIMEKNKKFRWAIVDPPSPRIGLRKLIEFYQEWVDRSEKHLANDSNNQKAERAIQRISRLKKNLAMLRGIDASSQKP